MYNHQLLIIITHKNTLTRYWVIDTHKASQTLN